MANRYLVATGNWSSTSIWSDTSGGSGGASVPTGSDTVYINANYTVTLSANASAMMVVHTNGRLNLGSYRLSGSLGVHSTGSNARILDLGSGTLAINPSASGTIMELSGTNLTVLSSGSRIETTSLYMYSADQTHTMILGNYTVGDLHSTFGNSGLSSYSTTLNITGSPTFRSLIIQSKNSAAHTVNIDSVETQKFVGIGSSSSNRLKILGSMGSSIHFVGSSPTSYGKFLDLDGVAPTNDGNPGDFTARYAGSNSIANTSWGDYGWLLQDPPKISTLIDPLTTAAASNTNWTVTGGTLDSITTGIGGGGYKGQGSAATILVSTETYDFIDSSVIIEAPPVSTATGSLKFGATTSETFASGALRIFFETGTSGAWEWFGALYAGGYVGNDIHSYPTTTPKFYKLTFGSSSYSVYVSNDGYSWTTITLNRTLPDDVTLDLLRSMRFVAYWSSDSEMPIGSINTLPIRPPTLTTGTASGTASDSITITESAIATNPDSVTIDAYGVVYSTSPNPTIADSSQAGTGTEADFDNTLTGLTENTTYYIRAYAQWDTDNYAYGTQTSRKTQARPTVALNTPADAGTVTPVRPTLDFTGTDVDNNTITYQLQLHTEDVWTAPQLDVLSAVNAGFSNRSDSKTDPFYSGNQIRYTPQADLVKGETYYWRVRGKDTNGSNTWGEWTTARSFTVAPDVPTVTLGTVYDVSFDTAEVDATVTADGGGTITERGVAYATTETPTTADSTEVVAGTTGAFTASLSSLAGTTTYYVRAYATNATGTSYSSQASFTTLQTPSAPTVVTGTAENITDTTAEYNGSQVTQDGTETVTERGIVFSDTETTPTTDDRKIVAPSAGLGSYDLGITGLDSETTYYVRAYAINSIGTGYGSVETFTTDAPFVPDEGDGYWTWTPSGSDAVVGRSQSTPANSSADLMLADLSLENGEEYTLYYSAKSNTNGETKMVLQWYDGATKTQQEITAGTPYTFTYDETKTLWAIRLFVTGASVEANNITATFEDMYLAKESTFSGFVPFVANGATEVKIENNWLIDNIRSEVIGTMFDAIEGKAWYPFNIDTEGLGYFEIGDQFTIEDSDSNSYPVVLWNSKLTLDGGIAENLYTKTPDLTETDYSKAGKLNGLWKRTQLQVDNNAMEISSLVEAIYDYDGVINTQFSEVLQDIDQVRTTVQGSGGVNLIANSVMYAYDSDGAPDSWTIDGTGTLTIQASSESLTAGAVSGNAFILNGETATQRITVRKDVGFIDEDDKTYYSLSARVKKNTVGDAHIKLINRNETLTIDLPDQTSYYWDTVTLEEILPLDDYYDVEIYSDTDANLQVTDLIFAPGKSKREWAQKNGEVMNTSVSVTENGMTIRSPQFASNYTKIDALGFEVHSQKVGGDRVFGFNDDETNVSKLKADEQISMTPIRIVPVDYGTYKGWAFTPSKEDA